MSIDRIKTLITRAASLLGSGVSDFCDRWEEEKAKDVQRAYRAQQEALLERAAMNVFSLNTGVVRATAPSDARVSVTSSLNDNWGDTVALGWMSEPGLWRYSHFSPARARIIALHLLARADAMERREPSSANIDKEGAD